MTRPVLSVTATSTATDLLKLYGPFRAVRLAEATATAVFPVAPHTGRLFAEAARIIERGFVEADFRQAGLRQ